MPPRDRIETTKIKGRASTPTNGTPCRRSGRAEYSAVTRRALLLLIPGHRKNAGASRRLPFLPDPCRLTRQAVLGPETPFWEAARMAELLRGQAPPFAPHIWRISKAC